MTPPTVFDLILKSVHDLSQYWLAKLIVSAGGALFGALFGAWREAYGALLTLVVLDLITGVWCAFRHREAKASVGLRKTAIKFFSYAVVLSSVHQVERVVGSNLPDWASSYTVAAAILYLAVTELMSVVENVKAASGYDLAFWLRRPGQPAPAAPDQEQP